ncbi:unnamed protein product [Malus baccata var. baccata]
MDDSRLRSSDLSYLISLRSAYVSLQQEDRCIVQPYNPHRFSRQFGFVQNVPGRLKEKAQSGSLQAVYMHWESCTRACTNAYITLPAKDEFRSNPVTRVYARWWSKVHHEDLRMASGTNSSHSRHDTLKEGNFSIPMQLVPFDCTSATPLQDRLVALVRQRLCSFPHHLDASEEMGDEVDSYEDGLVLRRRQQVLNKRPLEAAQVDSDVNFRHKKKEVFRPPQSDGRVSLEKDVGPFCSFDLATVGVHSYMDMLLGGNLPTDGEIGNPPGEELVQNLPNFPSLPCAGEGVQESIIRPTPLPASSAISLRGPNLSGTEQFIHRLKLRAAFDVKSHIESRISKCSLEDLALLKEDLLKLVSTIDDLNVDSSSLRIKIAELMVASTEYSSLRAISLKKLSPDDRAQQLAAIDLSLARVRSSQQVASGDYQVRLDALVREREQLGTQASQLENVLAEQKATLSQHHEEISRLEQEKGMAMDLPTLSPTEVETLKTLEGLLQDRLRSFSDISFQ